MYHLLQSALKYKVAFVVAEVWIPPPFFASPIVVAGAPEKDEAKINFFIALLAIIILTNKI